MRESPAARRTQPRNDVQRSRTVHRRITCQSTFSPKGRESSVRCETIGGRIKEKGIKVSRRCNSSKLVAMCDERRGVVCSVPWLGEQATAHVSCLQEQSGSRACRSVFGWEDGGCMEKSLVSVVLVDLRARATGHWRAIERGPLCANISVCRETIPAAFRLKGRVDWDRDRIKICVSVIVTIRYRQEIVHGSGEFGQRSTTDPRRAAVGSQRCKTSDNGS